MRRVNLKSAWRNEAGAVAIEFALLAPAVLVLIFIIFEVVLMFSAQSVLDKTVMQAARELRTNQPGLSGAAVGERIRAIACEDVRLLDCDAKLQIQIASFSQLADMSPFPPPDAGTFQGGSTSVQAGVPGSFLVMRLDYRWEFWFPGLGALAAINGGSGGNAGELTSLPEEPHNFVLLSSGTAFRREF